MSARCGCAAARYWSGSKGSGLPCRITRRPYSVTRSQGQPRGPRSTPGMITLAGTSSGRGSGGPRALWLRGGRRGGCSRTAPPPPPPFAPHLFLLFAFTHDRVRSLTSSQIREGRQCTAPLALPVRRDDDPECRLPTGHGHALVAAHSQVRPYRDAEVHDVVEELQVCHAVEVGRRPPADDHPPDAEEERDDAHGHHEGALRGGGQDVRRGDGHSAEKGVRIVFRVIEPQRVAEQLPAALDESNDA